MKFNPCGCWNPKRGAIVVGIWMLIFALIQIALFSWQTWVMNICLDRQLDGRLGCTDDVEPYCPCVNRNSMTSTDRVFHRVFVVQIVIIIKGFLLLGASVIFIWGIHTGRTHPIRLVVVIRLWVIGCVAMIQLSITYSSLWFAEGVDSYWVVLSIAEAISVLINIICLIISIIACRKLLHGWSYRAESNGLQPTGAPPPYVAGQMMSSEIPAAPPGSHTFSIPQYITIPPAADNKSVTANVETTTHSDRGANMTVWALSELGPSSQPPSGHSSSGFDSKGHRCTAV